MSEGEFDTIRERIATDPRLRVSFLKSQGETIRPGFVDEPTSPSVPIVSGTDRVVLRAVLGRGGMSVVYDGIQTSLGRRVAVKTAPAVGRSQRDLLHEAWLTSALEHPNIVPVHEIETDDQGRPLVVLRQIDGVPWGSLLRNPAALRARGVTDALEWNLEILGQVCRAVHFAHSRGVIHRDLKPDNVMIGAFGEVILVDWGLAVSLEDDGSGRLPLARDILHVAGTPGYMAPELLDGNGRRIGPRTDVYLLGATLYEVLSGQPPHEGHTIEAVLGSMLHGPRPLPPDVPIEIRQIAERALAPKLDERFESAEEFRLALERFLQHRGATRLVEAARQSTIALEQEISRDGTDPDARFRNALRHFSEARFGYQQALAAWPEGLAARDGLERAVRGIVEVTLRTRSPEAATALLSELPDPPDDLRAKLQRALAAWRAEREALEREAHENDPMVGHPIRQLIVTVMGSVAAVLTLGLHYFVIVRGHPRDHRGAVATLLGAAGLAFGLRIILRRRMSGTKLNRRLFSAALGAFLAAAVLRAAVWALGVPLATADILTMFVWCLGVSGITALFEPAMLPAAVVYWLAFAVSVRWPETRFLGQAVAHLSLLINGRIAWRKKPG